MSPFSPFLESLFTFVLVLAVVGLLALLFATLTFSVAQVRLSRQRARDALARQLWTIAQHAVALARAEASDAVDIVNVPVRAKVLIKVMVAEIKQSIHAAVGVGPNPAALESWFDGLLQRVLIDEKKQERERRKRPELHPVPEAPTVEVPAVDVEKAS